MKINIKQEVSLSMPVVMVDEYVPNACKTLSARRALLSRLDGNSKLLNSDPGMQPWIELRVAPDSSNRKWFYAVDTKESDIVYLMHLNPLRFKFPKDLDKPDSFLRSAMYQGSVWRADGSPYLIGPKLPSALFWRLFNGNQNWFSDTLQSKDGKRFWENRIWEALNRNLPVYAVHFSESSDVEVDSLVQIHSGDSIQKYWTYEVDKDDGGMYWRFAIVHP